MVVDAGTGAGAVVVDGSGVVVVDAPLDTGAIDPSSAPTTATASQPQQHLLTRLATGPLGTPVIACGPSSLLRASIPSASQAPKLPR